MVRLEKRNVRMNALITFCSDSQVGGQVTPHRDSLAGSCDAAQAVKVGRGLMVFARSQCDCV
jgi:hypothetical protein